MEDHKMAIAAPAAAESMKTAQKQAFSKKEEGAFGCTESYVLDVQRGTSSSQISITHGLFKALASS